MTDEELRDDWEDGLSEEEIAAKRGVPLPAVLERKRALRLRRLPERWVPNEEEIAAAAAKIRDGWSEAVRESRRVVPRSTWSVPVVSVREMPSPDDDGGAMPPPCITD